MPGRYMMATVPAGLLRRVFARTWLGCTTLSGTTTWKRTSTVLLPLCASMALLLARLSEVTG